MSLSRRLFLKIGAAAAVTPAFLCKPGNNTPETGVSVIALGIMQDGGMPQLGCDCERCSRAALDYTARRFVASLGIMVPGAGTCLIDATPDIREQMIILKDASYESEPDGRNPVDGIFLTHAHMGHYTGLMHLGFESLSSDNLPVYCTPRMAGYLRKNGPWSQLVRFENIKLVEFEEEKGIGLGSGVSISPFKVPHRQEFTDTVGFRIKGTRRSIIYIPDIDSWDEWTDDLAGELSQYDTAVIDGSFYSGDELPGRDMSAVPHPLISDTMNRLKGRIDLDKTGIYFTHFNHTNPALNKNSVIKKSIEGEGFHCLEQGMTFPL